MTPLPRVLAITPPRGSLHAAAVEAIASCVPTELGVALVLRNPGAEASPDDPRFVSAVGRARALDLQVWSWTDGAEPVAGVDAVVVRGARELDSTGRASRSNRIWGRSCHRGDPAESAAAFDCFAPVFRPQTDGVAKQPVGLTALREHCEAAGRPVYALGGVTPQRVESCFAAGSYGVAAIGAVFGDDADPRGFGAAVAACVRSFFG